MVFKMVTSADPGEISRLASTHLGLHCFLMIQCINGVKIKISFSFESYMYAYFSFLALDIRQ